MDIVIGILGLAAGVAVCLAGLRLFAILLPVWGFVAGFFIGAAGVSAILGDGFLETTLGFVIGFIVALVFAALSYLYWYTGVLLAAGTAGGLLGASLFASFGVDSGWALFFIGLIAGALFLIAAFIGQFPIFLVVLNTALAGSAIAIGGILLIFDRIDRHQIGTSAIWEKINDNWILWILWIVAATIGFGAQMRDAQNSVLPDGRWVSVRDRPAGSTSPSV